jgi:hypothetical protein
MDKHDVSFAAPRGVKRPAGALGEHLHINAGLLLEDWKQIPEQARIVR